MSHRNTIAAAQKRAALKEEMGNICWACGCKHNLHFDHPKGKDYESRNLSSLHRINRYWQEWNQGLLRLLCEECNTSKAYNNEELPPPPGVAVFKDNCWQPF
jgi:protein-arginine kinase activator protein McsA